MANSIPTGFGVEKVECIPPVVMTRRPGRWFWLREQITLVEDGETLRVTCPNKQEALRAYQSIAWKNTGWLPGYKLTCRTAPKADNPTANPEQGWYLYVHKRTA